LDRKGNSLIVKDYRMEKVYENSTI